MRRVWEFVACRDRLRRNEEMSVFDLHLVAGNAIVFETGLAEAGIAVKLPRVPGAHHVVAVQAAFSQGPAHVIADARNGAELAVAVGDSDLCFTERDFGEGFGFEAGGGSEIDPVRGLFHETPLCSLRLEKILR